MNEKFVTAGSFLFLSTGFVDVLTQDILQLPLSEQARLAFLPPYVLSVITVVTGLVTTPSSQEALRAV